MGVEDIEYVGNTFVAEWKGARRKCWRSSVSRGADPMMTRYFWAGIAVTAAVGALWGARSASAEKSFARILFDGTTPTPGEATSAIRSRRRAGGPRTGP